MTSSTIFAELDKVRDFLTWMPDSVYIISVTLGAADGKTHILLLAAGPYDDVRTLAERAGTDVKENLLGGDKFLLTTEICGCVVENMENRSAAGEGAES